ncbi:MAG TPA: fibronectin type III domain-containing protein, partial [Pirellulales bacterium]|nr:fibronectin type III domain-containing protein [Pirellulales bacterium]
VNPGQPLADTQLTDRGFHADQWQVNAYFVNYQDVLNAATAVKNGTATTATLQVAPSSIASLGTLGGSPPTAGAGDLWGSYFNPTTDNYYLLLPDSHELLVWHVAAPSTVPTAPTGLAATGGSGQISLSWTAATGASTYDVYRGTTSGGEAATPIATGVTGTSYVDKGLPAGTTYYYKITAVNSAGESAKSAEVSATTISAVPTGLTATGGGGQISLSWTAATGASTYNVYRGTTSGGEAATPIATGVTGTSYVDKGLPAGTTYYYEVTALNSAGESAKSGEASAVTITSAATASFVAADASTQGTWHGTYGADGYNVIGDAASYPSYAQVSTSGNQNYVWASSTSAAQALQKETNLNDRIAATWYAPSSFTLDVNLTDGSAHQLALYLLDWDKLGRSERIDVLDATTGTVLDSQTAANFSGGEYLRWTLGGHVDLRFTSLSGPNAVVSGLFFGQPAATTPASASFVQSDSTTQGNWQNAYGSDGYNVIGSGAGYPTYAQVSASGEQSYVWAASTSNARALEKTTSTTDRIAATWYSPSSFTLDVNLTDENTHEVSLYLLDWDQLGRSERVDVIDPSSGAVLNSQTVSGFGGGEYLTWKFGGHVQLRITATSGPNAVVSGLFFGNIHAPASASFVQSDGTTEGNWQNAYGPDGYNVVGDAASYPSYARVNVSGQQSYVWAASTSDSRALQKASDPTGRIAATWYSPTSFTIDVTMTDGKTHEVSLYLLDWDGVGRSERVDLVDPSTGSVLNTQTASSFGNGEYLTWTVGGHVQVRITELSGANAVLSGLFFGNITPPASNPGSALFVTADTTTSGTWQGKYGSAGYDVFDNAVNLPSYAQLSVSGQQNWVWASSTTDARALQKVGSPTDRIAATWYAANNFTVDLNLTDGKTHQVAAYLLDWDSGGRTEQVSVLDAATGATLDTHSVSNFVSGEYLVWKLSGHVRLVFTHVGGVNAVLSGLFFD